MYRLFNKPRKLRLRLLDVHRLHLHLLSPLNLVYHANPTYTKTRRHLDQAHRGPRRACSLGWKAERRDLFLPPYFPTHIAPSTCPAARNPLRIAACTVPQLPVTSVCSPAKNSVSSTGSLIRREASTPPTAT